MPIIRYRVGNRISIILVKETNGLIIEKEVEEIKIKGRIGIRTIKSR
jgi:hypothetical protein